MKISSKAKIKIERKSFFLRGEQGAEKVRLTLDYGKARIQKLCGLFQGLWKESASWFLHRNNP